MLRLEGKIVVFGRSDKFLKIIQSIHSEDVAVIPWRDCTQPTIGIASLVYVVGYNYNTFNIPYADYIAANVIQPIDLLKKITDSRTKVVYINTQQTLSRTTFSRYVYAKHKLSQALRNLEIGHLDIIELPVIIKGKTPQIHGGVLQIGVFRALVALRLIETIDFQMLRNKIVQPPVNSFGTSELIGRFLRIPRTQLIDRFLRVICG